MWLGTRIRNSLATQTFTRFAVLCDTVCVAQADDADYLHETVEGANQSVISPGDVVLQLFNHKLLLSDNRLDQVSH